MSIANLVISTMRKEKAWFNSNPKMLELTNECQIKYGSSRYIDSELPSDLRFVSKDQLPLRTPPRFTSSTQDRWRVMMNDYIYNQQLLFKIPQMNHTLQQKKDAHVSDDLLVLRRFTDRTLEVLEDRIISLFISDFLRSQYPRQSNIGKYSQNGAR